MLKKTKQLVYILIIVYTLIYFISVPIFASDFDAGELELIVEIGTSEGSIWDQVEIPLTISGVPESGINYIEFVLNYDSSDLDIITIIPGEILTNPLETFAIGIDYNSIVIMFINDTGIDSIKDDGVLLKIVATIRNEHKLDLSEISLKSFGTIILSEPSFVNPVFSIGGVHIIESAPSDENTVFLQKERVLGEVGDIVEIPINLTDVSPNGVSHLDFLLDYNPSSLKIISLIPGEIVPDPNFTFAWSLNENNGHISVMFCDNIILEDGEFVKITAEILHNSQAKLNEITLWSYTSNQVSLSNCSAFITGGIIIDKVFDHILGDLNGDGIINSIDYVLMKRYILEIDTDIPAGNSSADLNGDGQINSSDYILLRRYILNIISEIPKIQH
ncbi:UNVERIFIED_CONTAM: dockerin type I repeat protein [Acetivibrio alkalicellulosi]